MTARLSAAESFLLLLDALPSVRKPRTDKDVMLGHAAEVIRDLLDGAVTDVPRPGLAASIETAQPEPAGPGHLDLSYLPPPAGDGEDMCQAESQPDPAANGARWLCTARRGHPERWHAACDEFTGEPHAAEFPGAAWPAADIETGLPLMALSTRLECGASDGTRWLCNAVQGHAPLDHVRFAGAVQARIAGRVLARWASVPGLPDAALTHWLAFDNPDTMEPYNACEAVHGSGVAVPWLVDCPACIVIITSSLAGTGNGHPLRPPAWVCSGCSKPCTGYRQDDGLCVDCYTSRTPENVPRPGELPDHGPAVIHGDAGPAHPSQNVPRPVDDGPQDREPDAADGSQLPAAVGPGHHDVPGQQIHGDAPEQTAGRQHHGPPHASTPGEAASPGRAPFRLAAVEDGDTG